jgi:hypothetical protein
MADFDNKERKPKGAMDPALDKTAATSKRPASTIKTADAAETLQDAATRVKDVVQDASARGALVGGYIAWTFRGGQER